MGESACDTTSTLPDGKPMLSNLKSDRARVLLQKIASLRARGIGDHIALPQLVVCGDQSVGKSSVLEGLTGLPFPRNDGLCTTFPTEIVFTHSKDPVALTVSIIPSNDRADDARDRLAGHKKTITDFSHLPGIIEEVAELMKTVDDVPGNDRSVFKQDILRIHVMGDTGLHLTVVDLPGLISVPNEQQDEHDVAVVHSLVDSYCQNPRTIILAVVQASNDIANQSVIQKSKKFDPKGIRTVGIITKPDLVNIGTESRIATLARNEDTTKLHLGFYLVRNPSPKELEQGVTAGDRAAKESLFFNSPPWHNLRLDKTRLGIASLQVFLQDLLERHIEKEMPNVRADIARRLQEVKKELDKLGEQRSNEAHCRIFLSRLAMRFHNLTTAALRGDYDSVEAIFFAVEGTDQTVRLRACVHEANTSFSDLMQDHGSTLCVLHKWKNHVDVEVDQLEGQPKNKFGQIKVTASEMNAFAKAVYRRTRGQELPGTHNSALLAELFHHNSRRWRSLTEDHVRLIAAKLHSFLSAVVHHLTIDPQVRSALLRRIETDFARSIEKADEELCRLCEDHGGPPITYNHYFTDGVQKARDAKTRELIEAALGDTTSIDAAGFIHLKNNGGGLGRLVDAMQQTVNVNMDEQACSEALDASASYYKVARKTFVDNVCVQVVERHLLKTLPRLFSPELVAGLSPEELQHLAAEEEAVVARRKELQDLKVMLQDSLGDVGGGVASTPGC